MSLKTYDIINATRTNFLKLVDALTLEELNEIPSGYSNNIAWNFCHIVAAQQIICYIKAGVDTRIPMERIMKYSKGTRPEGQISQEEIDFYKEHLFSLIENLQQDEESRYLHSYEPFTTMYGVELASNTDATEYVATHDALHYGYSLALKRAILTTQIATQVS